MGEGSSQDLKLEGGGGDVKVSPPKIVKVVKRLVKDVKVLKEFFKETKVPRYKVRVSTRGTVLYVGGDASGAGFGSSVEKMQPDMESRDLSFEHGEWKGVY